MTPREQLAGRRREVWAELRTRWGRERAPIEDSERPQGGGRARAFAQFLRYRAPSDQAQVSQRALRDVLEAARRIRNGHSEGPAEESSTTAEAPPRQRILAEIAGDQFSANMGAWLGSVDAEHELSSTALPELLQLQKRAQHRHRLFKAMVAASQRELDQLETHIRALKSLEQQSP